MDKVVNEKKVKYSIAITLLTAMVKKSKAILYYNPCLNFVLNKNFFQENMPKIETIDCKIGIEKKHIQG